MDVYHDSFQKFFITATEKYYVAESAAFVANNSVPDYMKKAEDRLIEEADRINLYLHDSTRRDLKDTCERVLIQGHQEIMWNEFQSLLDTDRSADLARMYGLLFRITTGLAPLRKRFEEHVKKAGLAAVERVIPAPGAVNEAGRAETLDPKAYIEELLSIYNKFSETVTGPFRAELGFNASLDKACREFVNANAATTTSTRSPELLASYCDQLLRKTNRDLDAESLEAALNRVMTIFKFIDDKDVFQKFYQKKLANRLIHAASASDDSESSMISKLKDVCGYDYTSKLGRMFSDVNLGRELTEKFREKERNNGNDDVDFSMMVLGTNSWPLHPPKSDFTIPRELQRTHDRFIQFYNSMHQGRKLTWLWHLSKNELKTTYLSQKYIFMTSTYQMAILAQFNEMDQHTFKELEAGTGLEAAILKAQLNVLVKAKVLLVDDDTYDLNMNFKSKKIRVQLNQPVRAEVKAESAEVLQSVDEDRSHIYQATIVRIMKSRKTMKHQALVQDVAQTISTKFTPRVPDIKKAIDNLIDKDYLERGEDIGTYKYLA